MSSTLKLLSDNDPGGQTVPPWAVEPTWVATPPRQVFGLGFVAQPSNLVVFW
jgi:hypothetical protein